MAEVEQGGHVPRIERECRLQFDRGRLVLPQEVGIDDGAIEVRLLGLCDPAIERLPVGSERRVELPQTALQHCEVEPAVRQVGEAGEQALIGGHGFVETTGVLELHRGPAQPLQFTVGRQCLGSMGSMVVRRHIADKKKRRPLARPPPVSLDQDGIRTRPARG